MNLRVIVFFSVQGSLVVQILFRQRVCANCQTVCDKAGSHLRRSETGLSMLRRRNKTSISFNIWNLCISVLSDVVIICNHAISCCITLYSTNFDNRFRPWWSSCLLTMLRWSLPSFARWVQEFTAQKMKAKTWPRPEMEFKHVQTCSSTAGAFHQNLLKRVHIDIFSYIFQLLKCRWIDECWCKFVFKKSSTAYSQRWHLRWHLHAFCPPASWTEENQVSEIRTSYSCLIEPSHTPTVTAAMITDDT